MNGHAVSQARPPIAAAHLRKDTWWALPLAVVGVLTSFIVYSTWAALQNAHYFVAPYLSPAGGFRSSPSRSSGSCRRRS